MRKEKRARFMKNETLTTDESGFECTMSSVRSDSSAEEELFEEGPDAVIDELADSDSDVDWVPEERDRQSVLPPTAAGSSKRKSSTHWTASSSLSEEDGSSASPSKRSCGPRGKAGSRQPASVSRDRDAAKQRWHDMEEEDIDPPPLSFRPVRQPGPQRKSRVATTPQQYFSLFFTDEVMDTLVANTNIYGAEKHQGKWCKITKSDIFSYLAMVIYMGIVKCPQLADYWRGSNLFSFPFPRRVMSRNKFFAISGALHMSDIRADRENDKKRGTPAYDCLAKIKPLYSQIVEACKSNFHPDKYISVDERMVPTKARIGLKQYIKSKPTKWGYELFVLADSNTGYTWNFYVYEGKSAGIGKGLSYNTVMSLVDFDSLGTGYQLYVDNFYSSPLLFRDLLDKQTGACGTIRSNRVGFPKTTVNDLSKHSPRGSIKWIRDGSLLFVKWKDTREVAMCSTIHKASVGDYVQRRVKEAGHWVQRDVPIPTSVKDYNQHMGGVDLSDALISYHSVHHKTKRWYITFFFHFVDIAIVNAHILHQRKETATKMVQKEFRQALVEQLAKLGSVSTSQPSHLSIASSSTTLSDQYHLPYYFSEGQEVKKSNAATAGRRNCRHCHRKTPVGCSTCDVPLCLVQNRNCFKAWHKERGL